MYEPGKIRLFYKAVGFKTGILVQACFWDKDLNKLPLQTFIELEDGLYYLDYQFNDIDTYVVIMYENSVKTIAKVFRVNPKFGVVYFIE